MGDRAQRVAVERGEGQQVVHQAAHAGDLAGHQAQQLRACLGIAPIDPHLEHLDPIAQRGQRRPQFVRGVGDETALRGERTVELADHVVERDREFGQGVAPLRHPHPLTEVAARDRATGGGHAA